MDLRGPSLAYVKFPQAQRFIVEAIPTGVRMQPSECKPVPLELDNLGLVARFELQSNPALDFELLLYWLNRPRSRLKSELAYRFDSGIIR